MVTALSPRQVEILSLLANGQTTKQIGMRMKLSPRTIKRCLVVAKECLNAETREHLVALAVKYKLVEVCVGERVIKRPVAVES